MSLLLEHSDPTDPLAMSPEARRDELASIFARAILRLPRSPEVREFAAESAPPGLALSTPLRPHRVAG